MKRTLALTIAAGLFTVAMECATLADDDLDESGLQQILHPFYLEEAGQYEFTLDGTAATRLKLVTTPVMSWTGLENGLTSGDLFVWTRGGRAEVIGCIGSLPRNESERLIFHEFHALTLQPLPAMRVANQQWAPEKAGADLHPIPDAPRPAERSQQRLVQMRSLARQFSARMETASRSEERLRMLPQPVFRNDSQNELADGAIFAFVWTLGTDPELLLLVESVRQDTDEGFVWCYAPLRFTNRTVALEHRGNEVWTVGHHDSVSMPGEPYITRLTGTTSIVELEDRAEIISEAKVEQLSTHEGE